MATTTAKKKPSKAKKSGVVVVRGKRKESIARATVRKGKGVVRFNSVRLDALHNRYVRELISEPVKIAPEVSSNVDIDVSAMGGGTMGQAQAARLAVARGLIEFSGDASLRERFVQRDKFLLAEDSRRVEPKKYKGPKARARFQKSYR